ncbi:MAG: YezD family protein [Methylophilus sp.]|uniref:YezD family protein n=1 Tax=Methylophilus sp. TaxID=29541 RepID=UPI002C8461CC|nr:YezD family protein [Methylophilus sp.]HSH85642.1 YezD family protein [Methylophilus sp.]
MSSPLTKPDIDYDEAVLSAVNAAIIAVQRDTGYGSIEITIHDGRVTQIERREKVRFEQSKPKRV